MILAKDIDHTIYGWWNPWILLLTVMIACVYFIFTGPQRHRFLDHEVVPPRKKIFFLVGLFIFFLALGSPLAYIADHYLFSVHMLQQSLLYLVMPPIILLGLPDWLIRPLWWRPMLEPILTFFTHPLIAIALFNLLLSLYHLPIIFDTIMSSVWLMIGAHLLLLLSAFCMWWPVIAPIPELDRLSPLQKMTYLFADSILLTPACALIIFAGGLMYESFPYTDVPASLLPLTPLDDQQTGGVIMKVIQEVAYGTFLCYTFFGWVRGERKKEAEESPESIPYFEMELDPDHKKV